MSGRKRNSAERQQDAEIGLRLRQARVAKALTQVDLAKVLDISFQQIQKYETGANRICATRILAVATALGVPVTYFYDGLDSLVIDGCLVTDPLGGIPDQAIRTARLLNDMPEGEVKDGIYALIKTVVRTGLSPQH